MTILTCASDPAMAPVIASTKEMRDGPVDMDGDLAGQRQHAARGDARAERNDLEGASASVAGEHAGDGPVAGGTGAVGGAADPPARAVLAADERVVMSEFDPSHDLFPPGEVTPLYRLDWVPRACDRFHRDPIRGMGDFRDLKQLLLFEVAR
jgi:hypothetical protein